MGGFYGSGSLVGHKNTQSVVDKKNKILSDKPEKNYSSRYDKDNQYDHTYLGLAFMTYS